ncbi:MAG: hypothetical protein ACTTJC_01425 [Campylobacter sp.]
MQGELYARLSNAPFFVTHNNNETRFWKVIKDKAPGYRTEISDIPKNGNTDRQVENLLKSLVAFKEDEFAKLLDKCHNIIRNAEKQDPSKAFDEISKILFMKVFVERNVQKVVKQIFFRLIILLKEKMTLAKTQRVAFCKYSLKTLKNSLQKTKFLKKMKKSS